MPELMVQSTASVVVSARELVDDEVIDRRYALSMEVQIDETFRELIDTLVTCVQHAATLRAVDDG